MKKFNYLLIVMLALSISIISSCTKDEEKDPPTIVVTEQGSPTYEPGTSVTYHIVLAGNEDLFDFWFVESQIGLPVSEITNIQPSDAFDDMTFLEFKNNLTAVNFDFTYNIPAAGVPGGSVITIDFSVMDKKDQETEEQVSFTVVAPAGDIDRFTAVLMGGQSNLDDGSFLDAHTGDVYLQAGADANQDLIDIIYYYGSTNKATLCAPSDATVGGGGTNLSLCESWTTPNITKFETSAITTTEFDAMTDDSVISEISGMTQTIMTDLAVDDVFSFETVDGKIGLVKVESIVDGADGTITIEVIIQK